MVCGSDHSSSPLGLEPATPGEGWRFPHSLGPEGGVWLGFPSVRGLSCWAGWPLSRAFDQRERPVFSGVSKSLAALVPLQCVQ